MKTVVITGAGRGIGFALTKQFAEQGYQVLGTYRDEKSAQQLLDFAKTNKSIITTIADVTDEKTFGPLKEQLKKLGAIDILINNSGIIGDKATSLRELNLKTVENVFQVNVLGSMRVTQQVLPFINKGGVIAQISSLMGSIADNTSGGYYDYRMSKTALNMFNMSLARELQNITCLTLHPGCKRIWAVLAPQ